MARIATGAGDQGDTGLADGRRLPKSSARIAAYGAVDELNACIGVALTHLAGPSAATLQRVQRELFDLGADLALAKGGPRITKEHVARLDGELDALEATLPGLKNFILPGGAPAAAALHLARTVCRRAEREVVALARAEPVPQDILVYLNRLGDLLFLMARAANIDAGRGDVDVHFK
ncbi:MAG TPA: cob(I)yrinic acid a,c-diamide adenosyltransferase [Candidatus Thermoplasmatota archaeon]|jgi:cob(I)alamin adenosyltransferase|nr:cob(I)yrinic acid a,c-diamide adenosyltransferase [Candidatus Thermoplasmatota archaeon]